VIWGAILALHAVTANYAGLMVVRTLLGVFESAISPGFSLITGLWYTPREHVSRHSIWFAGNSIASLLGSMVAYGALRYNGPLAHWKVRYFLPISEKKKTCGAKLKYRTSCYLLFSDS